MLTTLFHAIDPVRPRAFLQQSAQWMHYEISHRMGKTKEAVKEHDLAVIYIHGTFDQPFGFSSFSEKVTKQLEDEQIDADHILFGFSRKLRFSGSAIDTYTADLIAGIQRLGHQHVILVGHSRGAIIAADAALKLKATGNIQVHQVHAIGGPFQGAPKAKLAQFLLPSRYAGEGTSIEQMTEGARFLTQLNTDLLAAIKQQILDIFFYSSTKEDIVPWQNCYPEKLVESKGLPARVMLSDKHSHLSELYSSLFPETVGKRISMRYHDTIKESLLDDERLAATSVPNTSKP